MLTVANIAKRAFDGVAGKVTDVIHEGTLKRVIPGEYDPNTGMVEDETVTDSCRAIFDNQQPLQDLFPDFVPGASDELVYLEGLTEMQPREGDSLETAGRTFAVIRTSDILRAQGLYSMIVRAEGA